MMQRTEQPGRQARLVLRDHRQALSLVPEQAPPALDDVPEERVVEAPVRLRLLPQPSPLGPEERVQL
jgi:hypothetical protein